MLQNSL